MNKGHMITVNHPVTEAQDRSGLVERYIGLCRSQNNISINEEIYIWMDSQPYRLRKALYSLRQAGLIFIKFRGC